MPSDPKYRKPRAVIEFSKEDYAELKAAGKDLGISVPNVIRLACKRYLGNESKELDMKKFGLVLHGEKGWSCGQQFAANKESAVSAAMSEGYTVWRAFDMGTEAREWWCAMELLAEISGVMNIDPNNPIRLGVIKEETK